MQTAGRARPRSVPQPPQVDHSNAPIKSESQSILSKIVAHSMDVAPQSPAVAQRPAQSPPNPAAITQRVCQLILSPGPCSSGPMFQDPDALIMALLRREQAPGALQHVTMIAERIGQQQRGAIFRPFVYDTAVNAHGLAHAFFRLGKAPEKHKQPAALAQRKCKILSSPRHFSWAHQIPQDLHAFALRLLGLDELPETPQHPSVIVERGRQTVDGR